MFQTQLQVPPNLLKPEPKVLSAPFFKFVTMGYWPAAVDWMWIEALQIIGNGNYSRDFLPFAANFYELATDLDPRFYELYEQAGVIFGFYFKSPDQSIHFLEKGIQNIDSRWTHPFTLHLLMAYFYSYEKKDWNRAKEYYLRAADLPGSPAYLQNMRVWLMEKDSEKKLANRVLTILIRQTSDELLKSEYRERLKAYD